MIQTRIDMDDAWPVLEPFAPYLVDVLLDFLDDVNAPGVVAIRRPMSGRSFSSMLADYFYSKMEQAPDHGSRFEHRDNRGQHHISFEDRVNIRVKKLDRKHLSSNLKTIHAMLWNGPGTLEDMGPVPRLELGYHLDALMNRYDSIHVLQRIDDEVEWRVQIYGERTDTFDIEQPRLSGMGPTRKVYQYRPIYPPGECR